MSGRPDARTLLEVQDFFQLPSPALVEKDWNVVRTLAAIQDAASDGLTLAFGGGTALGRAYGLLDRMSEDIDLRIVGQASSRGALQRFRRQVNERLEAAGFNLDGRVNVKQADRYVRYDLPYDPAMRGEGILRPEIKIELAAFPVRRPVEFRPVRSFVAQAHDRDAEVASIACVPLVETAAEKFVALTRRQGAVYAGAERDPTLVRHVYDLMRLDGRYDLDDAAALALETMASDTDRGHAAYKADPLAETLLTTDRLWRDEAFATDYANLMRDMVYGDRPSFSDAIAAVQSFGARLKRLGLDE